MIRNPLRTKKSWTPTKPSGRLSVASGQKWWIITANTANVRSASSCGMYRGLTIASDYQGPWNQRRVWGTSGLAFARRPAMCLPRP